MEYKTELIKKVRADTEAELDKSESPWKLRQVPDLGPQEVVSGNLTKRGAVIKNWKKRWFVVYTNGNCEYFVKEGDSKAKGTMPLEGYSVNADPKGEIFTGKPYGIQLEHPNDEDKRVWYIFAETEEEKKTWVQSFTQACRVATGYVNPDEVVRNSFKSAYIKLRRSYGMYYKLPKGLEQDALSETIYDRLYSVVVYDVVCKLDGIIKKTAIKFVKQLISTSVTVAWKALDDQIGRLRPTIEQNLRKVMKPFVEQEDQFKDKINDKIKEKIIEPAVSKVLSPFFKETISIVYPMLMEAFVLQLEISSQVLLKLANEISAENSAALIKELPKRLNIKPALALLPAKRIDTWIGKVDLVLRVVSRLDEFGGMVQALRTEINEVLKPAVHVVFPATIETDLLKLSKNTIYTFEMDYKENSDAKVVAKGVIEKLQQDLSFLFKTHVNGSLKEFVSKPYDEYVCTPASDIIQPLESEIPDDFKDFIDPQGILSDILDTTLTNCVDESTVGGFDDLNQSLISALQNLSLEARQ